MLKIEEDYKNLINSSPVFKIDKEKDFSLWTIESRKLMNIIVQYIYEYIWKSNEKKDNYALELVESIQSAINSYDIEKGEFLHYFNKILANKINKDSPKQTNEEARVGMKIPKQEDKNIRLLIKYSKMHNLDFTLEENIDKLSFLTKLSRNDILKAIKCYKESNVISIFSSNKGGEEVNLLDCLPASGLSLEDIILGKYEFEYVLNQLEAKIKGIKTDQGKIISYILTSDILHINFDIKEFNKIREKTFFQQEVYDNYINNNYIFTHRDIAKIFNRNEASISRTYKNFIKELKEILNL